MIHFGDNSKGADGIGAAGVRIRKSKPGNDCKKSLDFSANPRRWSTKMLFHCVRHCPNIDTALEEHLVFREFLSYISCQAIMTSRTQTGNESVQCRIRSEGTVKLYKEQRGYSCYTALGFADFFKFLEEFYSRSHISPSG